MLNVACFVQSCLTDADFVIFSNYCLIGTRLRASFFGRIRGKGPGGSPCTGGGRYVILNTEYPIP